MDNIEVCNIEMIKHCIRELKKVDHDTPNSKPENSKVHSSCGYSPDVEDNRNIVNKVTRLAKETQGQEKTIHKGMGMLKNLGTINISDIEDTEDESSKHKKRPVTRGDFVRPAPDNKRLNIDKGKLPFGESYKTLGDGELCDDIKPFNSDYRRGATAKVNITIIFAYYFLSICSRVCKLNSFCVSVALSSLNSCRKIIVTIILLVSLFYENNMHFQACKKVTLNLVSCIWSW